MRLFSILLLVIILGCSKDEQNFINNTDDTIEEPVGSGAFGVSPGDFNLESGEENITLKIRTNNNWKIKEKSSWISTNITTGTGNYDMDINIYENKDANLRYGSLIFSSNNKEYRVEIRQQGFPLKLISHTGLDGIPIMQESNFILFNKSITLNYIKSIDERYNFHAEESQITYFDDKKGLSFNSRALVGGEDLYEFSVNDQDGNTLKDIVSIPIYSRKFILPGTITKIVLDQDNLWVLSGDNLEDFKMHKFKISKDTIFKESDFTVSAAHPTNPLISDFFINPYNDLIYISDYGGEQIKVFDTNGSFIKDIIMESSEHDHPNHPLINPIGVGFNNSGLGILSVGNPGYSGISWRYIDSRNNDLITSPNPDDNYYYDAFKRFKLSYDKSQLFTIGNTTQLIKMYNSDGHFSTFDLISYDVSAMSDLVPNQLNSKIYVQDFREQIIDIDGSYHSPEWIGNSTLADFSYDPNRPNYMYAISSHNSPFFALINFNAADSDLIYRAATFLNWTNRRGIKTTSDNNYVIAYSNEIYLESGSQLIFFKTEMFE